jgi:hypothetical protein
MRKFGFAIGVLVLTVVAVGVSARSGVESWEKHLGKTGKLQELGNLSKPEVKAGVRACDEYIHYIPAEKPEEAGKLCFVSQVTSPKERPQTVSAEVKKDMIILSEVAGLPVPTADFLEKPDEYGHRIVLSMTAESHARLKRCMGNTE